MNPRAGEQRWLRLLETLAGLALLAMLALTVADVFGRYLVNRPVPGVTELVQYTMVLLVFAGLPIVTHRRAHISVSLMDNAFSGVARRIQLALIHGTSAFVLIAMSWILFVESHAMRESEDVIGALRLPVYPAGYFMAAMSLMAGVVCLRLMFQREASGAAVVH